MQKTKKMQKTIGGDRLGSGKKMKVDLHGYERSTHDLGYVFRTTMSAGTLVPFMTEIALPGDTFDIKLNGDFKTLPTVGPLFGSFKAQYDLFLLPIRLYQALLHNNALGIGMKMADVKLPTMTFQAPLMVPATNPLTNIDNAQVNPSCLLSYTGLRGIGSRLVTGGGANGFRSFMALYVLGYWDIYKNYYANKQEERGYYIHTTPTPLVEDVDKIEWQAPWLSGTGTVPVTSANTQILWGTETFIIVTLLAGTMDFKDIIFRRSDGLLVNAIDIGTVTDQVGLVTTIKYDVAKYGQVAWEGWRYRSGLDTLNLEIDVKSFLLSNIDDMRNLIIQHPGTTPFEIIGHGLAPYDDLAGEQFGFRNMMASQEGLGLKCYQSDILNNWISTDWIDGINGISDITSIDTTGGSFSIDTFQLSKKVYDMLNRIAVSGGSYDDWLDAVYANERYTRATTPMYMGGLIKELVFQEVVSNAEAGGGEGQPLGTLAGKGVMASKHKGGNVTIKVDEPSFIMGLVSLTPRIDYSQGNDWAINLKTLDDLHKPALDQIGYQDLITEQMAWWDTWETPAATWEQKSAGKQPAWLNYMTNINRTRGNFAIDTDSMFMTLNRRFQPRITSLDPTRYSIGDITTYIDPRKYNNIFAQTSLDSQNFWCQIGVDITARRKMSAKIMPNL